MTCVRGRVRSSRATKAARSYKASPYGLLSSAFSSSEIPNAILHSIGIVSNMPFSSLDVDCSVIRLDDGVCCTVFAQILVVSQLLCWSSIVRHPLRRVSHLNPSLRFGDHDPEGSSRCKKKFCVLRTWLVSKTASIVDELGGVVSRDRKRVMAFHKCCSTKESECSFARKNLW